MAKYQSLCLLLCLAQQQRLAWPTQYESSHLEEQDKTGLAGVYLALGQGQ